jgi:CheY-like chemotaxis protein
MKQDKWIIFVDDDADDRLLMCDAFPRQSGFQLLALEGARDLFDHLGRCRDGGYPCLIILDINMPKFSGWEIIELLKQHEGYGAIPLYIYSTASRSDDLERASAMDIPYLAKPMVFDELVDAWRVFIHFCNGGQTVEHSS